MVPTAGRYYYPEYPWLWNHTNCPDPCLTYKCPKFAKCTTASSTKEDKVGHIFFRFR